MRLCSDTNFIKDTGISKIDCSMSINDSDKTRTYLYDYMYQRASVTSCRRAAAAGEGDQLMSRTSSKSRPLGSNTVEHRHTLQQFQRQY